MSFFRAIISQKTKTDETPEQKFIPQEILATLKAIKQAAIHYHNTYINIHRDFENLRINQLATIIDTIEKHLETHPNDYRFCKLQVAHYLAVNLQQTQNYKRWNANQWRMNYLSLGMLHQKCADLLPVALIDALVMIRARPLQTICYISDENKTVTLVPRFIPNITDCLKDVDPITKNILESHPHIYALVCEIELKNYFQREEINKTNTEEQHLLVTAKEIFSQLAMEKYDENAYAEFKRAVLNSKTHFANDGILIFQKLFHLVETLPAIVEYGRRLMKEYQQGCEDLLRQNKTPLSQ